MKNCLLLIAIFTLQYCNGQDAKVFLIKDKDTLNFNEATLQVMIETTDSFMPFNSGNNLVYPNNFNFDSINSIIVLYLGDTISFFNLRDIKEFSQLTLTEIKSFQPNYKNLFRDKANMYFSVDTYPFENDSHKKIAKDDSKRLKSSDESRIVVELNYQFTETTLIRIK